MTNSTTEHITFSDPYGTHRACLNLGNALQAATGQQADESLIRVCGRAIAAGADAFFLGVVVTMECPMKTAALYHAKLGYGGSASPDFRSGIRAQLGYPNDEGHGPSLADARVHLEAARLANRN